MQSWGLSASSPVSPGMLAVQATLSCTALPSLKQLEHQDAW